MEMVHNGPLVGVIGGGAADAQTRELARAVGRLLAEKGAVVICGGLGGVMEAACRGAKEAGGLTIGVLPGTDREEANEYVDIPIVTGLADARNVIIARTASVLIAIDGQFGTLSEVAFALKFRKPVVALRSWDVDPRIEKADTPERAVSLALERINMQSI
jgi:uncharacterized protein (TIGR00725 family)